MGLVALWSLTVWGDGKVYWELEEVPSHIPYQRALILFDEGRQTLVLQSQVETQGGKGDATSLAWVVPVPSVPELDTIEAGGGTWLFQWLNIMTPADVISTRWICYAIMLIVNAIWLLYCVGVGCRLRSGNASDFKTEIDQRRRHLGLAFFLFVVLWLLPVLIMPASSGNRTRVEIVDSRRVGIFDVQVIRSDTRSALVEWLNENGFDFGQEDRPAFDRYIEQGWCFVVSKVRVSDALEHQVDGLIDPLVMRFASERPVYPLALTATQGKPTQVLVYVLSDRKMVCEGPLKLRYFQERTFPVFQQETIFKPWEMDLTYLHRFRSRLSPDQMKEDAVFVPATNDEPVQEKVWRW